MIDVIRSPIPYLEISEGVRWGQSMELQMGIKSWVTVKGMSKINGCIHPEPPHLTSVGPKYRHWISGRKCLMTMSLALIMILWRTKTNFWDLLSRYRRTRASRGHGFVHNSYEKHLTLLRLFSARLVKLGHRAKRPSFVFQVKFGLGFPWSTRVFSCSVDGDEG